MHYWLRLQLSTTWVKAWSDCVKRWTLWCSLSTHHPSSRRPVIAPTYFAAWMPAQRTDNHNQNISPHRVTRPVWLMSRHAIPTGTPSFKDGKLAHVTDPQRTDFRADKTIPVCSRRSIALWPFRLYLWQASSLFQSMRNPPSCLRLLLSVTRH